MLALDVGERRIGVAVSDPLGITAQSVDTIHRTSLSNDLDKIAGFLDFILQQVIGGHAE